MIRWICAIISICCTLYAGNPAALTPEDVVSRSKEMLSYHAVYKQVTPELASRVLITFLDELDPLKLYFLQEEVTPWISPSSQTLQEVMSAFRDGKMSVFQTIFRKMRPAIERRDGLEERLQKDQLPKMTTYTPNITWAANQEELYQRLRTLKATQIEAANRLGKDLYTAAVVRMEKRRMFFEEERIPNDPLLFEQTLSTFLLKAFAAALDSESMYFTPAEAQQLLVGMQHKLCGIGAILRDDFDGFTIIKLVEGGPAARQGGLEIGDKIIAVNDDPVIGLELSEAVELISGNPGSPVELQILRKKAKSGTALTPKKVRLYREAIVVKELRYKTTSYPVENGIIACLQLRSFYQDDTTSSVEDLIASLQQLEKNHHVRGIILDLRYNPGGLLSQGVAVASLFLDHGVVVSLKEGSGCITHMRNVSHHKPWEGPLLILINKASASASEIVAQTLQDWGRALVVGETSFGKGSFQMLTMNTLGMPPSPRGEFKVTQGRYYTVSGKSPQLVGVQPDIYAPSALAYTDIGERFNKYPLPQDSILPNYIDTLEDVSVFQRSFFRRIYEQSHQEQLQHLPSMLPRLKKLSETRINKNENYQKMLQAAQNHNSHPSEETQKGPDLQLEETVNIMNDILASSP
jgi:carboxyl-terminal processing protease